jgi:lysozyme
MNEALKTSQAGMEHIKKWEGCVLKQYICPAGKPTIGIGHVVLPSEKFPEKITEKEALDLLSKDVARFETAIYKNVSVPLNQNQFDALVSFLFNVGEGGIVNSGVQRELNANNYDKVPEKLLEWCKFKDKNGVKQTNVGLLNRRKSEAQLFSTPAGSVAPPPVELVPWTKENLSATQNKLKALGLYTIKVDGLWGPSTQKAVTEYANKSGLNYGSTNSKSVSKPLLESILK